MLFFKYHVLISRAYAIEESQEISIIHVNIKILCLERIYFYYKIGELCSFRYFNYTRIPID